MNGWTRKEIIIAAICMAGGGAIVRGVYLQWGSGAEFIAIGAYTIISVLAYFAVCERKESIAEFEEKRKQNSDHMDKIKREMNGSWRKP